MLVSCWRSHAHKRLVPWWGKSAAGNETYPRRGNLNYLSVRAPSKITTRYQLGCDQVLLCDYFFKMPEHLGQQAQSRRVKIPYKINNSGWKTPHRNSLWNMYRKPTSKILWIKLEAASVLHLHCMELLFWVELREDDWLADFPPASR